MSKMRGIYTLMVILVSASILLGQKYSPYTIAFEKTGSLDEVIAELKTSLSEQSIDVIGQYMPASDYNRRLIIISNPDLKTAVNRVGGLTGFAGALRIGLFKKGGKIMVTYTTPEYWGNAYFQKEFDKVSGQYSSFHSKLKNAFSQVGTYSGKAYGSKNGISESGLQKYHYMMGMPYFKDTVVLGKFNSHAEAVSHIDQQLAKGVKNVKKAYKLNYSGKDLVLYGMQLSGEKGESKFVPIIDIGDTKHVAFLPYELLVIGKEVHMLHGRYRIALSFPDLTMRTFTKIMSTPGDIADLMRSVVQ